MCDLHMWNIIATFALVIYAQFMDMTNKIFQLISELNLSPAEFAEKIGVSKSSISSIKTGRTQPTLFLVNKIKETYPAFNTNWLFDEQNNTHIFEAEAPNLSKTNEFNDEISDSNNNHLPPPQNKTVTYLSEENYNVEKTGLDANQTVLDFDNSAYNSTTSQIDTDKENNNIVHTNTKFSTPTDKKTEEKLSENSNDIYRNNVAEEKNDVKPTDISKPKIIRIITLFSDGSYQQFTPE